MPATQTILALALAAAGLSALAQNAPAPATLPEGKGRALVVQLCNSCHAFASRVGGGYTARGWPTVLRMMTNHGLALNAEQVETLTDYLVKNYPERPKPAATLVDGPLRVAMKAFAVPTPGSRPHDPLATRDGALWYTGQMTNRLGRIDPATGQTREYELKTPHSGPHGLMEDASGNIWYTGNTGALIGRLDPKTGGVTEYPMPDKAVGDPHTLIFDQRGILWFTAQNANKVGRLDPQTGDIKLLTPPTANSRPYGMAVNSRGEVYYVAFGTNKVGVVNPQTLAIRDSRCPTPPHVPGASPSRPT
ncbi:MAG: hypothetical protein ACKOWD_11495, partial [Rhodoferax sp.]